MAERHCSGINDGVPGSIHKPKSLCNRRMEPAEFKLTYGSGTPDVGFYGGNRPAALGRQIWSLQLLSGLKSQRNWLSWQKQREFKAGIQCERNSSSVRW